LPNDLKFLNQFEFLIYLYRRKIISHRIKITFKGELSLRDTLRKEMFAEEICGEIFFAELIFADYAQIRKNKFCNNE